MLRLTPIEDGCTERGKALAGAWWKMGCTIADDNCLGLLDAGTYKSQFISPRLDPAPPGRPIVGGLTYTVPDGWANASDWPESFEIVPAAELPPIDDADRTGSIGVFTQPTAMTQDPPCSDQVEPGVGRTVNELTDWLGTVPGRHDRADPDHDRWSLRSNAGHLARSGMDRHMPTGATRSTPRDLPQSGASPSAVTNAPG